MIKHIKIKNHKAIRVPQYIETGQINVICGKNNSGKTTVLEALNNQASHGIGKKIDDVEWMATLFQPQANKYSGPQPEISMNWFRNYITSLIQDTRIWYSDETQEIIEKLRDSQQKNDYLRSFRNDIFNFDPLLSEFFKQSLGYFTTVLIPPKRNLEFQSEINLNQEILPSGIGIINQLFFLKNQDLESKDHKLYEKIYEIFFEITGSRFNVVPDKSNQIKLVYCTNGNWIPASDSGLGLSDVLIIISLINVLDKNIFLLEEPENHLHAEYQKKLLKYINTIKQKQFFITTHSSIFLDPTMVSKIFFCTNEHEITLSDQTSKSEILYSLGYSVADNLVSDLIVLLEGPTDIPVIREMLGWLEIESDFNIKFWPIGGDIMSSLDLSVFAEVKKVFALIDSDPGSKVLRTRFMRNCSQFGIYCKKLDRYSIENYFTIDAIRKAFPDQIPKKIITISPTESVDNQIGFKSKNKSLKTKNEQIVKFMNASDIEGTDLLKFLEDIRSFLINSKNPKV